MIHLLVPAINRKVAAGRGFERNEHSLGEESQRPESQRPSAAFDTPGEVQARQRGPCRDDKKPPYLKTGGKCQQTPDHIGAKRTERARVRAHTISKNCTLKKGPLTFPVECGRTRHESAGQMDSTPFALISFRKPMRLSTCAMRLDYSLRPLLASFALL